MEKSEIVSLIEGKMQAATGRADEMEEAGQNGWGLWRKAAEKWSAAYSAVRNAEGWDVSAAKYEAEGK